MHTLSNIRVVKSQGAPRLKPSEAEERAGQGSCKSWKTTFRTMLKGKAVTIQDFFSAYQVK